MFISDEERTAYLTRANNLMCLAMLHKAGIDPKTYPVKFNGVDFNYARNDDFFINVLPFMFGGSEPIEYSNHNQRYYEIIEYQIADPRLKVLSSRLQGNPLKEIIFKCIMKHLQQLTKLDEEDEVVYWRDEPVVTDAKLKTDATGQYYCVHLDVQQASLGFYTPEIIHLINYHKTIEKYLAAAVNATEDS